MKNLSAVLFDVDGTLYSFGTLRLILAVRFILTGIRHPLRTVRAIRILIHYRRALEWMRHQPAGVVHAETQSERTSAAAGIPLSEVRETVDRWTRRIPLLYMGLCARRELIRRIKEWHGRGVPLGVYSDYPAQEKLQKLGIGDFMSVVLYSGDPEVGAYKPDPKGLQVLAGKMGLVPEACVYLGDREELDLRSAERAGMRGLLISNKNLAWLDSKVEAAFPGRVPIT